MTSSREIDDKYVAVYHQFMWAFLNSLKIDLSNPIYGFFVKEFRHFLVNTRLWNLWVLAMDLRVELLGISVAFGVLFSKSSYSLSS